MGDSIEMKRLLEPHDAFSDTSSVIGLRGKAMDLFNETLDDECDTDTTYDSDHTTKSMKEAHSSPYRWFMLFLLSFNTLLMSVSAICLSTISDILLPFYDEVYNPFTMALLVNIPSFMYILIAVPISIMMARYGLRPVIITASMFTTLSCGFRYAGAHKNGFIFIVVSQFIVSISFSMLLQMPAKLAKVWFPKNERNIATSIGAYMYILGIAVGYFWSTQLVHASKADLLTPEHSLQILYGSQIGLGLLSVILTLILFKEEPGNSSVFEKVKRMDKQEKSFLKSIKKLMANKRFHMVGHAYGIYWGINHSLNVLSSFLVRTRHVVGGKEIGWMTFVKNISSVATVVAVAMLLDRFQRYRLTSTVLHATSFVLFTVFYTLTIYVDFFGLYVSYCIYGLAAVPYITIGLQHISVLTTPVPETTSNAFILVFGNIYGSALSLTIAYGLEYVGIALGYIISGLYLISTLLVLFASSEI